MKSKRTKYWLLLAALLAVNIYILLHRNEGFKYYPFKTVSELYVTDSSLYLKDLKFEEDTVELCFSKSLDNKQFHLLVDDSTIEPDYTFLILKPIHDKLRFELFDRYHSYKLTSFPSNSAINIELKIDHSTLNGTTQNELLYCNLPGPQIKIAALETWKSDKGFSDDEKQNALQLLKEKTVYNKDSSDFYNTLAIAKFASTLCNNNKGIHAYKLSELRPYGQIQEAMKCNADLACGNYSAIVGYLFSCAGIANRVVTFQGPAGNWQYGVHYYNEIYLKEQQQWALIDAGNKIIMPFDSATGKFLNAVDINKLIKLNATTNKKSYTFKNDSLQVVPYDSINNQHVYYNQSNANLCFLHANADVTSSSFKSFFEFYTFSRDVDFYSDVNRNDWCRIIIKDVFALLFVVVLVLYLFAEIRYKVGKAK